MERRAIAIQGTVQGVGFRPFVHRLASALELGGFVRNHAGGVTIEVEGEAGSLDQFISELVRHPPPLAKIDDWTSRRQPPRGDRGFQIDASDPAGRGAIVITPDAATCHACLAELFNPRDRRYRYPFINCTHCGPRLTIVTGAPYDRDRTTMARFPMCRQCREEYEDPSDRRFHAQPIACPECGPRLALLDSSGSPMDALDPLEGFIEALQAGKIGAMKGLGGYHLICDARNSIAVAELRRRKHRDEKPLAIMVRDLASAQSICSTDAAAAELLVSSARPIVLLPKRSSLGIAQEIAPGNPFIGVMLPYTPLHHLLLHGLNGAPLVMTSGNQSDEPIAYDEPDAMRRLGSIADIFLTHDRPIHVRCDDSVTRMIGNAEAPVRRSRGVAPQPIALPMPCPAPILAVGGQMKATFALGSDRRAIVSHHMGDLDNFEAFIAFKKDVALYEELFSLRPAWIAHDLHPDYASTRYGIERAQSDRSIKLLPIQHHHAHMASCMAEHGLSGPVIGVTLDGTGYGLDGAIWGGEFLVGDYRGFRRAAHLRHVGLPGGEQAVREPWRMAAAYLHDAGASCAPFEKRIAPAALRTIRTMIERRFNAPPTSSAGRLFDAVASLATVRDRVSYEGQAAMELEWLATGAAPAGVYPFAFDVGSDTMPRPAEQRPSALAVSPFCPQRSCETASGPNTDPGNATLLPSRSTDDATQTDSPMIIDTRPMIRAIAQDVTAGAPPVHIARKFHATCVQIISATCLAIRKQTGLNTVVLSGGVFMNALLSVETEQTLTSDGFLVYRQKRVPSNDGGLSLGQVAIAASQLGST